MDRFEDKVAVVVGGASGMGLATAVDFAREGARVIVTGRDRASLDAAVARIGDRATAVVADISRFDEIAPMMARIGALHGRIDALFVNAGIGRFRLIEECREDDWDALHDVNLKAAFFVVQQALPWMPQGSAIVLCGSVGPPEGAGRQQHLCRHEGGAARAGADFGPGIARSRDPHQLPEPRTDRHADHGQGDRW